MARGIAIEYRGQTGRTATSAPTPIRRYRYVPTPPATSDIYAEAETRAIEGDADLLNRVLNRLNEPTFIPVEDALRRLATTD